MCTGIIAGSEPKHQVQPGDPDKGEARNGTGKRKKEEKETPNHPKHRYTHKTLLHNGLIPTISKNTKKATIVNSTKIQQFRDL